MGIFNQYAPACFSNSLILLIAYGAFTVLERWTFLTENEIPEGEFSEDPAAAPVTPEKEAHHG